MINDFVSFQFLIWFSFPIKFASPLQMVRRIVRMVRGDSLHIDFTAFLDAGGGVLHGIRVVT